MANSKKAPPTKVELARAELEKARGEYNDLRKPDAKPKPKEKSLAAARLNAAARVLEAEQAQEVADAARKKADEAIENIERVKAAK